MIRISTSNTTNNFKARSKDFMQFECAYKNFKKIF